MEYENELSRIGSQGGRYITDALMLKCATNAKSQGKKDLLRKEGKTFFLGQMTHINLERQKLMSMEKNEKLCAQEKAKTGWDELGLGFCSNLQVIYLFENRLT